MAEDLSIVIRLFDKTKKGLSSVTKNIAKVAGSVVSLRSALILVGGAAGFGFMVKSSLNATDALKKTADKIGTTTAALGGLRYAAQITGVATNTMDMALQRFTRRTAEAAKGTGEAKGAIKELGINAKDLNRMPLDERMLVLADAFGNVTNESDKLRLAFKLFDSEGAALVNTLALGRDGLKELLGEAKLLGLTMSDNAAAGVEKANDEITKLLSLGKGLKDQFSAALAPAITEVTKKITAFFLAIAEDEGGVEKWAKGMAVSVLESTLVVAEGLNSMLKQLASFGNKALGFLDSFEESAKQKYIDRMTQDLASLGSEIANLESKDVSVKDILLDAITLDSYSKKLERYKELNQQIIKETESLGEGVRSKAFDAGDFLNIDSFTETIGDLINSVNNGFVAVTKGAGGGAKELSNIQQAYIDWQKTIMTTDDIVKSFTTQGLDGMTNALTAGVTGAANFADAMKAMAKSVVDSLIKMLIQKYIVDAAFGAITSYFGGGGTGSTGSGMTSGGGVGMGQMYSNTAAIGGPVVQGERTLVGERGPEIFVPNASGSIIPNNKLGGGGVTINQTINVTTGIQSTVRAEIVGLMPQIAQAAKGAVADARVRGGNFSKAMVGA